MPITETDLPGVGKKYEIDIDFKDRRLVIVTHNTGKREVYLREDRDADSEKLFELSDRLARTVGTILEGAYFQPVASGTRATTLGSNTQIEWFDVATDASLVGRTLSEILANEDIDVAVTAIQRGEDVIPASEPTTVIEAGDTVVVVGTTDQIDLFEPLVLGSDRSDRG